MIYSMHPDYSHYKVYTLDNQEVRQKLGDRTMFHFSRNPTSYLNNWQPIEISFVVQSGQKKNLPIPDIMVRNGRLFLNQRAYFCLNDFFQKHGEFLPVTYNNGIGYLFEVISTADTKNGLDKKLSTKNSYGDVDSIAFIEENIKDLHIFRTEFDAYYSIYCQEEVKNLIESENLKGITFSMDLGNIFPPSDNVEHPVKH